MINLLVKLDYKGPFWVLGHLKSEDVALTLKNNLKGLQSLLLINEISHFTPSINHFTPN